MAERAPGTRLAAFCLLAAAVIALGALAVALFEPEDPPTRLHVLPAALALAVAAAMGLFLLSVLFRRLPKHVRRIVTRVIRIVVVLGAAALVVLAVAYGDAPSWLRWLFFVAAVVIVLAGQWWPRVAWPDVAFFAALGLAGFALVAQSAFEPPETPPKKFVVFELQAETVTALERVAKGGKMVLLVVKELRVSEDEPVSHESVRYEGVPDKAVPKGDQPGPVRVKIERGKSDAGAMKFSADLVSAKTIYVMSG